MNGDGIGTRPAWNRKGISTEDSIVQRRQVDDGYGAVAGEKIVGNNNILIDGGCGGICAGHLVLHIGKLAAEEIGGFGHDIESEKALLMSPAAVECIVVDDELLGSRPFAPILVNLREPDQRRIHVEGIIPRIAEAIIVKDDVAAYPGNNQGNISARGNRLARHARNNRVRDAKSPALAIAEAETNQILQDDPVKRGRADAGGSRAGPGRD